MPPLDSVRRYAVTIALTELPRSAALIRAARYTSSGTETVMFFIGTQCHRNTAFDGAKVTVLYESDAAKPYP